MERNYLTADTEMPPSIPYPRFLTGIEISSTAKSLYVQLLDKTVSEKEADDNGYLYTRFPISGQMVALSKSDATVKSLGGTDRHREIDLGRGKLFPQAGLYTGNRS